PPPRRRQNRTALPPALHDQVHQTPADMYKKPGEKAQLKCSHNIQGYNQILWYRQSENQEMQFLGYMLAGIANLEPGVTVQMGGNANQGENSTLTTEELSMNSSAVYFCAASYHSAAYHCSSVQKPPITHFSISVLQLAAPCTWINPF
uniref:Ig-like domain-containing protein n=1 Tax=Myripristis murdjan TaxID=586833 RepID=A0A667YKN9_9TELE